MPRKKIEKKRRKQRQRKARIKNNKKGNEFNFILGVAEHNLV